MNDDEFAKKERTPSPPSRIQIEESKVEEEREECRICYDELSAFDFFSIAQCNHSFCQSCLESHIRYNIRQVPIICPKEAETDCSGFLSIEEIKAILPMDEFIKHHRIHKMHHDPSLVQCSRCGDLTANAGIENPITVCVGCNHVYCKIHGDAHGPTTQSCIDFHKQQNDRHSRKSLRAVRKLTKPCSHCKAPIFKYAGCDHVVCTACNADMCWRCGTHVYMTGGGVRTCHRCRRNYVDHRHLCAAHTRICLIGVPLGILYMLIGGIVMLASCCCCGCMGCGAWIGRAFTEDKKPGPCMAFQWLVFVLFLPVVVMVRFCGLPICQTKWNLLQLRSDEVEQAVDEEESDTSDKFDLTDMQLSTTSDMQDPPRPLGSAATV